MERGGGCKEQSCVARMRGNAEIQRFYIEGDGIPNISSAHVHVGACPGRVDGPLYRLPHLESSPGIPWIFDNIRQLGTS